MSDNTANLQPNGIPRSTPVAPRPASAQQRLPHMLQAEAAPENDGFSRPVETQRSIKALPILEMLQRTNEFLAGSPPELRLVRADRCQELEYWLISTLNEVAYDFLDSKAIDPTRRRYHISPRLMVP